MPWKCMYVCVCVFLYFLHTKYQNLHSTTGVRTFWGSKTFHLIPHYFKGQFEEP